MDLIYLKINEKGETVNAFESLGMAICGIEQEAKRIDGKFILQQTLTKLAWKGQDGVEHSYEIKQTPIVKDVTLDYMCGVSPVRVKI